MKIPLRVLLVEDSEDDAGLLIGELRRGGYDPLWQRVDTAPAMKAALEERSWDIVLSDYVMPRFSGQAALELLKQTGLDLPFIVVSGKIGEEVAVDAMRAGAQDYIFKEGLTRLVPAIRRELAEAELRRERKRAEEALRSLEQKYRTIVETASEAIWTLDANFLISYVNPRMTELLGYPAEEMLGKSNLVFVAPDMREAVLEYRKERLRGLKGTHENRMVRKDGSVVTTLASVAPLFDDVGQFQGLVAIHTDITELRRAEEALRGAAHEWRATFDAIGDTVWLADLDGTIQRCNKAGAKSLGRTFREIIGQPCGELMHCTAETVPRCPLVRAPASRHRQALELRRDGRWLREVVDPLVDDAGNVVGGVHIVSDITDQREAQEALRRSLAHLRETVKTTVDALARTIEKRDPYTAGHQQRVAHLACAIAREMGLSQERIDGIDIAGVIHDIGKIAIPSEILSSPRELSACEIDFMKTHAQTGYDILKAIEFPWPVAEIVLQHHERMDGSGYPASLAGDNILTEARILAVADVVEAMISHRPYRPALGVDKALEEISEGAGVLYDPEAAKACLTLFTEKGFGFE